MITIINTTNSTYTNEGFDHKDVQVFNTRELRIKHCTGCFKCWVHSPGTCVQNDDLPILSKAIMSSELVVFVSDIKAGLIDSELKRINDKMLPLLMPYMEIYHEEVHHQKRYEKYPDIALVLRQSEELTDDVMEINETIYHRMALNFHSNLRFCIADEQDLRGLQNELNHH